MSAGRPSAQQERYLALGARYGVLRELPQVVAGAGGWRRGPLLTRCLFFALGLLAAGLATLFIMLMLVPAFLLVSGVLLLVIAEWLIRERRIFAYGVEEALVASGALALFSQILSMATASGYRYATLVYGAALLAAGARVANPLMTALALLVLSSGLSTHVTTLGVALLCLAVAILALLLGGRRYPRPSHDAMLDYAVIVMAPAAYYWLTRDQAAPLTLAGVAHAGWTQWLPVVVPLLFAVLALALGLARRTHAPLVAAGLCVACVGYELREFTDLAMHARLMLWGAVLLAAGIALDRFLRQPRRGITSRPDPQGRSVLDLAQLAGAAALSPAAPATPPAYQGEGGQFGGGGASGQF